MGVPPVGSGIGHKFSSWENLFKLNKNYYYGLEFVGVLDHDGAGRFLRIKLLSGLTPAAMSTVPGEEHICCAKCFVKAQRNALGV